MKKGIIEKILAAPFSIGQFFISENRTKMSKFEFIDIIMKSGGSKDVGCFLWELLSDWSIIDSFTPHPSDNLEKTYGIAEEELEIDILEFIMNKLNIPFPSQEEITNFGRITTPLDVARFVEFCKIKSNMEE